MSEKRIPGTRLSDDILKRIVEHKCEVKPIKLRVACPCCHGQRTQFSSKSGMREICPGCDGRGTIENPNLP